MSEPEDEDCEESGEDTEEDYLGDDKSMSEDMEVAYQSAMKYHNQNDGGDGTVHNNRKGAYLLSKDFCQEPGGIQIIQKKQVQKSNIGGQLVQGVKSTLIADGKGAINMGQGVESSEGDKTWTQNRGKEVADPITGKKFQKGCGYK